jgi:hypothetical protein
MKFRIIKDGFDRYRIENKKGIFDVWSDCSNINYQNYEDAEKDMNKMILLYHEKKEYSKKINQITVIRTEKV